MARLLAVALGCISLLYLSLSGTLSRRQDGSRRLALPRQDTFQWPAAPAPCTLACGLEATPDSPATGESQPGHCYGSACPEWPPPTLGPPQAQSPVPAGWLCARHLPGTEPQPPSMAAHRIGRPTGLVPHGSQQPPQLWLGWNRPWPCLS
ncbi:PREDICTED: ADM2 isoform X1 [Hipposideros armiger]|uniref:ADM2 isoform X1 n=1 Tax=Hipposideros armiger TaxID=186990 RepID=A0A8B7TEE0_HIPAR|nr:PREDICTED: ADM2 isoform X1 [Hipposideros armiger]